MNDRDQLKKSQEDYENLNNMKSKADDDCQTAKNRCSEAEGQLKMTSAVCFLCIHCFVSFIVLFCLQDKWFTCREFAYVQSKIVDHFLPSKLI